MILSLVLSRSSFGRIISAAPGLPWLACLSRREARQSMPGDSPGLAPAHAFR